MVFSVNNAIVPSSLSHTQNKRVSKGERQISTAHLNLQKHKLNDKKLCTDGRLKPPAEAHVSSSRRKQLLPAVSTSQPHAKSTQLSRAVRSDGELILSVTPHCSERRAKGCNVAISPQTQLMFTPTLHHCESQRQWM